MCQRVYGDRMTVYILILITIILIFSQNGHKEKAKISSVSHRVTRIFFNDEFVFKIKF